MANNRENEIEAIVNGTSNALALNNKDFLAELQSAFEVSPLAVGVKFSSDDLVNAARVVLRGFDWVDFTKKVDVNGVTTERDVQYSVWSVELWEKGDKEPTIGYCNGGITLNKLAKAIDQKGLQAELASYGVEINARWDKTSNRNSILLIDIVG